MKTGWINEKSFRCVFKREKACDWAQCMNSLWESHDLQSSSYWSWQKPYTWQDTYFATAVFFVFLFFFLSLAGWYLSCWCLEGGSGSWQTYSKWNIATSLLITPHPSYQHPGSNTAFSYWECKWAPPDRKQKEGAASHCRISYSTTEKGRVWLWWHALCRRWSATKRLLWKLTGHSLPQGTAFPAADFPLSHLREIVCSYLVSNRPSVKHYVKSALSTGGRVWGGGQCRRQVSPSWLSPSCRHLWQGPPV